MKEVADIFSLLCLFCINFTLETEISLGASMSPFLALYSDSVLYTLWIMAKWKLTFSSKDFDKLVTNLLFLVPTPCYSSSNNNTNTVKCTSQYPYYHRKVSSHVCVCVCRYRYCLFSIGCWNCSDSMVCFAFHFNWK